MDDQNKVPEDAPSWFKEWAANHKAEEAQHTNRFWMAVLGFFVGNLLAIGGGCQKLGKLEERIANVKSQVDLLATKDSVANLTNTQGDLMKKIERLPTKEDVQKEIRNLRKELLENDVDILGFVLEAHGDKKIRAAIEKKIGKMQEKIEILEKSLAENQPESPEHFQVATGTIENYDPATALVKVRSDDSLIEGKMPLIPMAARLFGSSGLTEVPLGTEHKGWEASFVLVRGEIGEPKIIRKVILFEPKP